MSFSLFKITVKNNWAIWLIFTLIMLGYLMLILTMYNPENMQYLEAAIEMVSPELAAAVGMDEIPVNLTDFAANYFYRFLVQLFLLPHVIILAVRLVVKEVDNGSMAYLLSTRVSRITVIATKAFYMAVSLFAMMAVVTLIAVASCMSMFPGQLDISAFLSLNFATFLTALTMASIVFFFSSIMDQSIHAVIPGAGILLMFFILSLLGRLGHFEGIYAVLGDLSIFRFLQARAIINGEINMWINNSVLAGLSGIFLGAGIFRFSKRDLPL